MTKFLDKEYKVPMGSHGRKYETIEEAYEAHKQRTMAHARANPEPHRARVKRYQSKPEIIERMRIKGLTANLTEAQRLKRNEYQRELYKRKKEQREKND